MCLTPVLDGSAMYRGLWQSVAWGMRTEWLGGTLWAKCKWMELLEDYVVVEVIWAYSNETPLYTVQSPYRMANCRHKYL